MGVLNLTSDSFYPGSRLASEDNILATAEKMLSEEADILDIGGQSTRPGAERLSAEDELKRVIPVIEKIISKYPDTVISIDTFYGRVATEAVAAGAAIVNDISAGRLDPTMSESVAQLNTPYILMHMQGEPQNMQHHPHYVNVVSEIIQFFSEKINELRLMGVNDIIIDPGFGFGKNQEHNIELMRHLDAFSIFGLPVLVGVSRKKMVQRLVHQDSFGALNGTTALNVIALLNGAQILRVHDVREAVEAVKIVTAIHPELYSGTNSSVKSSSISA